MAPEVIRTGIVEDDEETRKGLAFLLNDAPGVVCDHAYDSVEDAIQGIVREPPHVLLLDIGFRGMDGIEGVGVLRRLKPSLAVIMLSVFRDEDRVFRAICAGACRAASRLSTLDDIS